MPTLVGHNTLTGDDQAPSNVHNRPALHGIPAMCTCGRGTTANVYLPRSHTSERAMHAPRSAGPHPCGPRSYQPCTTTCMHAPVPGCKAHHSNVWHSTAAHNALVGTPAAGAARLAGWLVHSSSATSDHSMPSPHLRPCLCSLAAATDVWARWHLPALAGSYCVWSVTHKRTAVGHTAHLQPFGSCSSASSQCGLLSHMQSRYLSAGVPRLRKLNNRAAPPGREAFPPNANTGTAREAAQHLSKTAHGWVGAGEHQHNQVLTSAASKHTPTNKGWGPCGSTTPGHGTREHGDWVAACTRERVSDGCTPATPAAVW